MNRTDRYRLEALMELAAVYPEARPTAELAARRQIPAAYLSRLLAELGRGGWVRSRRGPGGGTALAQPPEAIPITAVIAVDSGGASLSPALACLTGIISTAVQGSVATYTVADLVAWERQVATVADYSI